MNVDYVRRPAGGMSAGLLVPLVLLLLMLTLISRPTSAQGASGRSPYLSNPRLRLSWGFEVFPASLTGHYIDGTKRAINYAIPVSLCLVFANDIRGTSTSISFTNHLQLQRTSPEHPFIKSAADVGLIHRRPIIGCNPATLSASFSAALGFAWVEDPRSETGVMGSLFRGTTGLRLGRADPRVGINIGFYVLAADHEFPIPPEENWAFATDFGLRPYASLVFEFGSWTP